MAGVAATGGSTNGVLHLLAVAREAGVHADLDELTEVASGRRCSRASSPSGRHTSPRTLHRAGGTPASSAS